MLFAVKLYGAADAARAAAPLFGPATLGISLLNGIDGHEIMGRELPEGIAQAAVARLKEFPAGMYASMYHDYAKGGPIEIEGMSGYLVREGRRLGIPTPHHAAIYAVLKPHRAGTPK